MKILIVDDSAMMRRLIRRALEDTLDMELEILEAGDGMEALSTLARPGASIDLILCDMNMPVMNGLSFLKIIRDKSDLREIPVVIVTADPSGEHTREALREGAAGVLAKPFRNGAILELVVARVVGMWNAALSGPNPGTTA